MSDYTLFYKCLREFTDGVKEVMVIHRYTIPKTQTDEPYLTQPNIRNVHRLILARELRLYAKNVKHYTARPNEVSIRYTGATIGHEPLERCDG